MRALTGLERDVLSAVASAAGGPLTVRGVTWALPKRAVPETYASTAARLRRLERRGLVVVEKAGVLNVYRLTWKGREELKRGG